MRRFITACCVGLMVSGAGVIVGQEAGAAPSADPGKPKITVSVIKHVPLTTERKKRRQAHLDRLTAASSSPEMQTARASANPATCGRFYSCDSNTLVIKEYRRLTDPAPFGTFFVDVDTIQTSTARVQRVALNEEITVTGFVGAPEDGVLALNSVGVDELGPSGSQELGTVNIALGKTHVGTPTYVTYGWYPKIRTLGSLFSYPELSPTVAIAGVLTDGSGIFQPLNLVRCDQSTNGKVIGCVDPSSRPQQRGMLTLPNILANIRNQVSKGAPTILHREADESRVTNNRNFFCPPSLPRPAGKSCDEYPFARSKEGGGAGGVGGFAFVPEEEQDAQGGFIGSFTQTQRLMDNDAYEVVIN